MAVESENRSLSIEVGLELRRKIEVAAAKQELPLRDYIIEVLDRATAESVEPDGPTASEVWAKLSARSFARDWASEENSVYDQLPQG